MARFSDIPKLIHGGDYQVSVPLLRLRGWIDDHKTTFGNVDLDPEFQRDHVWNDLQRSRYVEFLLRGGQSSRVIYWNHPAYSGSRPANSDLPDTLLLVDGKQRLNACLMFLDNKIPVFGHYFEEYDDPTDRRCALGASGAHLLMNVNNLSTYADVLQWYLDLNSGGVVHTDDEIERVRRLHEAVKSGQSYGVAHSR